MENVKLTEDGVLLKVSVNEDLVKQFFPDEDKLELSTSEEGYDFHDRLQERIDDGLGMLVNKIHVGVVGPSEYWNRHEDLTIYTYQDNKYVYVVQELIQLSGGEYGDWTGGTLNMASVSVYHRWEAQKIVNINID